MRKIVVLPSDPMQSYLELGQTYAYYKDYFNPGGYFDGVFALSPWGNEFIETHDNVTYIKSNPRKFSKIINCIKPDVIRAYGGYHCADWLALSAPIDIPTVVSIHDTNPDTIYNTVKYIDNVISMSQCVQDAVRNKINCQKKGEWIMGNRIDTDLFSYKSDEAFVEQQKLRFGRGRHILHVGRKSKQKNIDTLIGALTFLPEDVSVVFVGKGDFEPYERLANTMKVSSRVYNVDHVNNAELPKWYSWCDCFCTPSRWEGFGFVFIEAASCKSPIVTSDIGPMNEYLTNGVDSLLVKDYENPRAIAEAILHIFENKEKATELGEKARKVGERFSKEAIDKQEISIYEEIISIGPRKREKIPFIDQKKLEWQYRKL